MKAQPWNLLFLTGCIVYFWIRGVFAQRTKHNERVFRQVNTQEKILIAIVIPGSVLPPLLYLFTPWLGFADYQLPLLIHVGGFVMMLTALWLFWRAHADL